MQVALAYGLLYMLGSKVLGCHVACLLLLWVQVPISCLASVYTPQDAMPHGAVEYVIVPSVVSLPHRQFKIVVCCMYNSHVLFWVVSTKGSGHMQFCRLSLQPDSVKWGFAVWGGCMTAWGALHKTFCLVGSTCC